jgi:hypothetical protein
MGFISVDLSHAEPSFDMNFVLGWLGPGPVHLEYYLPAFGALFIFFVLALHPPEISGKRAFEIGFFSSIAATLFAWRWPVFFAPAALNPDEGSLVAYALKATVDFAPWRGFDAGTSGPLNSYIIALPAAIGLPINFFSARVIAVFLMLLALVALYFAAKWTFNTQIARLSVIPPLLLLSLTMDYDFVHYSSEHLSICLTTIAIAGCAYLFNGSDRYSSLVLAGGVIGLCLGAACFSKLQAAPFALTLLTLAAIATLSLPRPRNIPSGRIALTMLASLGLIPATILASLLWTGLLQDAYLSYIGEAIRYVGDSGITLGAEFVFFSSPMYSAFVVGALGVSFLGAIELLRHRHVSLRSAYLLAVSLVLLLAAFFIVYRPQRAFPHYLLFSMFPISFFIAAVLGAATQSERSERLKKFMPFLFAGLFIVPSLSVAIGMPNQFIGELTDNLAHPRSETAMAIARYAKPGDKMAVWGWASQYYVQTGTIMATRDADTTHMTYAHPNRDYRRRRYLSDIKQTNPPVFIDTVAPQSFGLTDRASQGHETFPALDAYIRSNYELKEQINGIRIYVRKQDIAGLANRGSFVFDGKAAPDIATFDNDSDQAVTFSFSASGTWSWAPGGPQIGPSGAESPAAGNFFLPGARSFGLIAKRGDTSFQYIGEEAELTLKPREVISFLMNDVVGSSADNSGSLKISWIRK